MKIETANTHQNQVVDQEPKMDDCPRHSWTAKPNTERDRNGDPIDMVCRNCGVEIHNDTPEPRMARTETWEAATAGVTFAEDYESDKDYA